MALLQNFMLITGGPGTGKTTTVAKLLGLICNNSTKLPRIALAAPTGKAAAHMARALQRALDGFDLSPSIKVHLENLEGQTVHRLLKLRPPQMRPAFNHEHPLALDVLVVDEASMLDLPLVLELLRAVPTSCRLVLLGDENRCHRLAWVPYWRHCRVRRLWIKKLLKRLEVLSAQSWL